ncbi:MAG: VWA domain-containing protein, partial [Methanosarcinales archaeon]|nr:VWA domain-containing protein [Methanosarcinales archaeon]
HEILVDVQNTWTIPQDQFDKIGPKVPMPPLEVTYVDETVEERYKGQLLEIYNETEIRKDIPISVVFGIDSSGSMGGNDPTNLRLAATNATINSLNPVIDDVGVVSWDTGIDFRFNLSNNFTAAKTAVGGVDSAGGTNMDVGLLESIDVMNASTKPLKVIIFLSNGAGSYTPAGSGGPASIAAANGYVIYSIGLGPNPAVPALTDMATATGGKYFAALTAANLEEIFDLISKDVLVDLKESWVLEWYQTYPNQYTEFRLPPGQLYLTTLSWVAPEAYIHIWDGDSSAPLSTYTGERVKFWYDPGDCTGLYINEQPDGTSSIRIYGTFGEGPGDLGIKDPRTGLTSENPPYTDPEAPFFPQAEQAPRKDFMTLNPAIMDHNQGWPQINLILPDDTTVERPKIKVFKRMWYEKEWFKDYNGNGMWDVVMESPWGSVEVVDITDKDTIHDLLKLGYTMRIHNNPEAGDSQSVQGADIYGPAIQQEFAYMMTDSNTMPIMVKAGSRIFIPMAHNPADPYRGLNSFDADGDGIKDTVTIQSEQTLGTDLDLDGNTEAMDTDGLELSNDESLVLVLEDKIMNLNSEVQFFDNTVKLININDLGPASASFKVCDNEGGTSVGCSTVNIGLNQAKYFSRGIENTAASRGPLYVKLVALSSNSATVEVGRQFGEVAANIEANPYWNQKAFIVDQVFYNVVAIKADGDNLKYIVFRQKLPKMPIKLKGEHLEVWDVNETLPEMSPFNM